MSTSNTICGFMFGHTDIEPNGDIKFCCAAWDGLHRDENGNLYNVNTHTLKEAWNSPLAKETRTAMIRGEKPAVCRYCWDFENEDNTKGASVRLSAANQRIPLSEISDRIEHAKQHDGELSDDYLAFDFQVSTGNLCNLACKMCNPKFSTTYQKFFSKIFEKSEDVTFVRGLNKINNADSSIEFGTVYDWPITNTLSNIFKDHIPTVKRIFFTGGEPTLIPEIIEFMDHVGNTEHREDLVMWPSTNCTNINKKLLSTLAKFDHMWINMSLDGMGDIAYIQRTPSNWSSIEKNMISLVSWAREQSDLGKEIKLNLISTITALNIHHILEFWEHCANNYYNIYPYGIAANLVQHRTTNFGIEAIPKAVIDTVVQPKLASLYEHPGFQSPSTKRGLDIFGEILSNTEFNDGFEDIQFCLDQVQRCHPELDIKQIYNIYYPEQSNLP